MANVLAVGLLIGRRRLWWRPFLLGFETFSTVALAFYVSATIQFGGRWLEPYLDPVLTPVINYVGAPDVVLRLFALICAAAVVICFPQLAFAFVGGFVFRWLRFAERSERTPG